MTRAPIVSILSRTAHVASVVAIVAGAAALTPRAVVVDAVAERFQDDVKLAFYCNNNTVSGCASDATTAPIYPNYNESRLNSFAACNDPYNNSTVFGPYPGTSPFTLGYVGVHGGSAPVWACTYNPNTNY